VIGISGGIDSATCAALAVKAFGPKHVFGLLMPEKESSASSLTIGREICEALGISYQVEDITPILHAAGCYQWRDDAIRQVLPEYDETYKQKIVVPSLESGERITFFRVIIQSPSGQLQQSRLPLKAYLQIVAATNFKQRSRKMLEYFHADRLNYAVIGTPNRLEYTLGFFVKGGDGLADIKPIAHLYKTQVYALANHLKLPDSVLNSVPTTDTYSLAQGQDEFYFALPYDKMDLLLYALDAEVPAAEAAAVAGLDCKQVEWVFRDIQNKRRTTHYLHIPPYVLETESTH
jgi:NAD+ synthase